MNSMFFSLSVVTRWVTREPTFTSGDLTSSLNSTSSLLWLVSLLLNPLYSKRGTKWPNIWYIQPCLILVVGWPKNIIYLAMFDFGCEILFYTFLIFLYFMVIGIQVKRRFLFLIISRFYTFIYKKKITASPSLTWMLLIFIF